MHVIIPKPAECTPLQYIRIWIFRMNQETFAEAVGTSQPTLSKHENSGTMSWDIANGIRALRKKKRAKFPDSVLFEGYPAHCHKT